MIDEKSLEFVYKQNLEDHIIQYLSEIKKIDLRKATDIYYHSRLAEQISQGMYGIENMDYKYLVQDMIENETELFYSESNMEYLEKVISDIDEGRAKLVEHDIIAVDG